MSMKPMAGRDGYPYVFDVGRGDGGLWLSGSWASLAAGGILTIGCILLPPFGSFDSTQDKSAQGKQVNKA